MPEKQGGLKCKIERKKAPHRWNQIQWRGVSVFMKLCLILVLSHHFKRYHLALALLRRVGGSGVIAAVADCMKPPIFSATLFCVSLVTWV